MSEIFEFISAEEISSAILFEVVELDSIDFPHPWSEKSWSDYLVNNSFYLAIHQTDKLNGFILYSMNIGDSFAHLLKICTKNSMRGNKIGHQLMTHTLNNLNKMGVQSFYLEVEENNSAAINLYSNHNFKIVHKKKGFYSDGTNALIMTRGE